MPTLTIDLREGFDHTPVVIRVDGRELHREPAATTRTQIGLAARVELELEPGAREVEVELPGSGARTSLRLDPAAAPFLTLDLDRGGVPALRQVAEPPRYL